MRKWRERENGERMRKWRENEEMEREREREKNKNNTNIFANRKDIKLGRTVMVTR